jgi:ABC-type polysaccharide/polyol phosphate export permease
VIEGSFAGILTVALMGCMSFAGIGLLVASRAQQIETVSGLMNLVMLPMYVFSGVFFSAARFPQMLQPFIQALPLTALNNALRAVIIEGSNVTSQIGEMFVMAGWGVAGYLLALRWFRWN